MREKQVRSQSRYLVRPGDWVEREGIEQKGKLSQKEKRRESERERERERKNKNNKK